MSTNKRTKVHWLTLHPFFEWIRKGIVSVKSIRIRVIRSETGVSPRKAERKRPSAGLERGIGSVYACVCVCVRVCPPGTPALPSCTCYEREKQRIGRAVFASVSVSSSKHRRLASVNNLVVVCPREVETSRPIVLSPADSVRRYFALNCCHENSLVDSSVIRSPIRLTFTRIEKRLTPLLTSCTQFHGV